MIESKRLAYGERKISDAALDGLFGGQIFDIAAIFAIGLGGVLLLSPIWALCNGINLLRWPAGALPGASPGEIAAQEMMQ